MDAPTGKTENNTLESKIESIVFSAVMATTLLVVLGKLDGATSVTLIKDTAKDATAKITEAINKKEEPDAKTN